MIGGSQRVTADGVVGVSGQAVRMYGATITSGATAGRVRFRNGTADTDTAFLDVSGEPNLTTPVSGIPNDGLYFPGGLFVDIDANTTAVVVEFVQVIAR